MNKVTSKLTVFFEEPFWVGVFERVENGKLSVCKVTFGAEPKDNELLLFIIKNYSSLKFSLEIDAVVKETTDNPKRIQREARKQTLQTGIGTKAQQALSLQREQMKTKRKHISREQKIAEKQRQFELKQQKRKEKHKGR